MSKPHRHSNRNLQMADEDYSQYCTTEDEVSQEESDFDADTGGLSGCIIQYIGEAFDIDPEATKKIIDQFEKMVNAECKQRKKNLKKN